MAENSSDASKTFQSYPSRRLCGLIAIETSGRAGSVAWAAGDRPPRLIQLDPARRTAATLSVALGDLLAEARSESRRVDVVAVASGPGSFTGLRIGVTAAKMLAYALDCPLVAVDTLSAMAAAVWREQPACGDVCVAINAYRQQLFVARWSPADWQAAADQNALASRSQLWSAAAWEAELAKGREGLTLAAEPAIAAAHQPAATAQRTRVLSLWPTAVDVAALGNRLAIAGHFVSPMELIPNYLRDSAAEEKLR